MKLKSSIILTILLTGTLLLCYLLQVIDNAVVIRYDTYILTAFAILFYLGTWLWFCPSIIRFLFQIVAGVGIFMCIIERMVVYSLSYNQIIYIQYGFYAALIMCCLTIVTMIWMDLTYTPQKPRKKITAKIHSRIVISILFAGVFFLFKYEMIRSANGWDVMAGYKDILIVVVLLFYLGTWLWFCYPFIRLLLQVTAASGIIICFFRYAGRYTGFIFSSTVLWEGFYAVIFMCGLTSLTGIQIFLLDKQQQERIKEWGRKNLTKKKILPVTALTILILSPIFIRRFKDYTYVSDNYSLTVVRNSYEIPIEDPDELLAIMEEEIKGTPVITERDLILRNWKDAEKNGVVIKVNYHGDGKKLLIGSDTIPDTVTETIFLINDATAYVMIYYEGNLAHWNVDWSDLEAYFDYKYDFIQYAPVENRMIFSYR